MKLRVTVPAAYALWMVSGASLILGWPNPKLILWAWFVLLSFVVGRHYGSRARR